MRLGEDALLHELAAKSHGRWESHGWSLIGHIQLFKALNLGAS
jgi:hypothetical protein